MSLISRIKEVQSRNLNPTQTVVLSFLTLIVVGTLLLLLPWATHSGSITFINALFTATSAVCVTGLVVVDTGTYFTTFGQLVILVLIQIGGLGLMTMSTLFFVMLGRRIGLRNRLIMREQLNQFTLSGVVRMTQYVVGITFIAEGLGFLLLATRFVPKFGLVKGLYYGLFHSVSAFCNAGFDVLGNFQSLTAYASDPVVVLTVTLLIITGGLGFTVLSEIINKHNKWNKFSLHSKIVISTTAILLFIGVVSIYLFESNNPATLGDMGVFDRLLRAWFHGVTPRTAGFNTVDTASLTGASLLVTIILMFIGASPASTGGGIKTVTFAVLVISVLSIVKGKQEGVAFRRRIPVDIVGKTLAVAFMALLLVVVTVILLTITEPGLEFIEVLFETVSAFGTVGLSMGITTGLSTIGKFLIIITMFAGRVGPLSLMMAVAQWQKPIDYHYPEERVMVG